MFTLLWSKILNSSIWVKESKETRLIWITILAMKNKDGIVQSSVIGLADRAKVTVDECRKALEVLLSPDPDDTSKVEEGRRLKEVSGGWQVINHDLYRFADETKREVWRLDKERQRAKKIKIPKSQERPPSAKYRANEARYCEADGAGDTTKADAIAAGEL